MPGWRVMHLLYLGGATVELYQNGGCDERGRSESDTTYDKGCIVNWFRKL